MHVLIVDFRLADLTEEGAGRHAPSSPRPSPGCRACSPRSGSTTPPARLRRRLSVQGSRVDGGLRTSDRLATVAATPNFVEITSRDFAVHEDLTRVTRPGLEILSEAPA